MQTKHHFTDSMGSLTRVILIDAVEFPPDRASHRHGSVPNWFSRHLESQAGLAFESLPSSTPNLLSKVADAEGVIISGSPRDAWSDDPDMRALLDFASGLIARNQPVLGVCFGHQLLGRALGGDVRPNPAGWEVGTCRIALTEEGRTSPLFAGCEPEFAAIESHRDAVLSLPSGARLLAGNPHTPIQAFAAGETTFGVQFHPEMDGDILRHIWTERRERLRDSIPFDLDRVLDSAEGGASAVLRNFTSMLP